MEKCRPLTGDQGRSQRGFGVFLNGLWDTEKLLVTEGISEVPEGVRDG